MYEYKISTKSQYSKFRGVKKSNLPQRTLANLSLTLTLSHTLFLSLSLSSITVMLSYFLALATRPALWMAETLAKAFFRKSGRVAHAASTALAWFLKMPLLFAPFNVEDGVFVPANSWISIVLLLAIPGWLVVKVVWVQVVKKKIERKKEPSQKN